MGRTTNTLVIAGALMALLGLAGFAIPVFATQQTTEVAKIGNLKIEARENIVHAIPPLLSGSALIFGALLVCAGLYRRR